MKKMKAFMFMMMFGLSFTACGTDTDNAAEIFGQTEKQDMKNPDTESSSAEDSRQSQELKDGEQNKTLVVYFSWADNTDQEDIDAVASASVKKPGDVAQLASWVSEETGGELFSIQVEEPYPADWDGCLERANQEKKNGTYPALKDTVENIEEYETIYLGYPNWWYSCPMALLSFFDENDLSGKQVYLFCSHGTGGLASSVKDISAAIPDARISDNVFDVYEEDAVSAKDEIVEWIEEVSK